MFKPKWFILISLSLVFILLFTLSATASTKLEPARQVLLEPATPLGSGFTTAPLGSGFAYQGFLKGSGGTPVSATCSFKFTLYGSYDGNDPIGTYDEVTGISVSAGYFLATVNEGGEFGSSAFNGEARWLKVEVKCGSESEYTALSPRQALTLAPYAGYAVSAPWSGITGMPEDFADNVDNYNTYTNGTGLSLSGGQFSLSTAYQLPQGCTNGYVPKWNSASGQWLCALDETGSGGGGDITGVSAGTGLFGGGLSGDVTLAITTTYRLPQGCSNGQVAKWNGTSFYWECNNDDNTTQHSALSGLDADDHTQYFNLSQNETVSGIPTFNNASVPFTVTSTNKVTNLNADLLDGSHSNSFASSSHNHWGQSWSGSGTGLTLSSNSYVGLSSSGLSYGVWSQSTSGTGVVGTTTAITGTTYGVYGSVISPFGSGVYGKAPNEGVYGESFSGYGSGVYGTAPFTGTVGIATSTNGLAYGVWGQSLSTTGRGVFGFANASSGQTYGVYGKSASTSGYGVYGIAPVTGTVGIATNPSGTTYGVWGQAVSTDGRGVYGLANANSGTTFGVFGKSTSIDGTGVYGTAPVTGTVGIATNPSGTTYGVWGKSLSYHGLGVYGTAPITGVVGIATNTAAGNYGVWGQSYSPNGMGVFGIASNYGIWGTSYATGGYGIVGVNIATSGNTYGVSGSVSSSNGFGMVGTAPVTGTVGIATDASGATHGVYGRSYSTSGDSAGVYGYNSGTSGYNIGVYGKTDSTQGHAFYGLATASTGLNYGIYVNTNSVSGVGGSFNNWGGGVALTARSNISATTPTQDIFRVVNWSDNILFKVKGNGNVYADGTYYGAGGVSAGSADFAEMVPPGQAELEAGDVLAIDTDGQMIRSNKPYQTNVAGIYSTKPGFIAGNQLDEAGNPLEPERIPLAVVGIVPVKASAENGAIQPGDLLTTSTTPGHAMKASPITINGFTFYPSGVVIGKALQGLESGTGVILVLVMLQ